MKPAASPLGKYSAVVAAVVVLAVIFAAIFMHVIGRPDSLIDSLATLAFGITIGTAGSLTLLNGTVSKVETHDEIIKSLKTQTDSSGTLAVKE